MGFRRIALGTARWGVWLLLIWILIRGVASFFLPPPEEPVVVAVEPPQEKAVSDEPGAFAALFAREYLTWESGQEMDRAWRLAPLIARQLAPQAGWTSPTFEASQVVEMVLPFRVTPQGEARWLVTVAARIVTSTAEAEAMSRTSRTLYLDVAVGQTDAGYLVYDYPTVVSTLVAAPDWTEPLLDGEEIKDQGDQVKSLLTGFLRSYTVGDGSDVHYYLAPEVTVTGLKGAQTFQELTNLTLWRVGEETWAAAVALMEDPVSKTLSRQRYTVEVQQIGDRWYIKQILQKGA